MAQARLPFMSESETQDQCNIFLGLANNVLAQGSLLWREGERTHETKTRLADLLAANLAELLELFAHVLCKKPFNRYTGDFHSFDFCCDVVLQGLDSIAPCLDSTMLQYQRVSQGFFNLLEIVMSSYPNKFAQLPQAQRKVFVEAVQFALGLSDPEVLTAALQTIEHILSFHISCDGKSPFGAQCSILFAPLLGLAFSKLSSEQLVSVADALFPLIYSDLQAFHSAALQHVRQQQLTPSVSNDVLDAFRTLVSANDVMTAYSERNIAQFRANLRAFVATTRCFVEQR